MDKKDSTGRYTDFAISIWVLLMGLLFVASSVVISSGPISAIISVLELIDISRYVYVVVLTVCVISAALAVSRRLSGKDKI